MNDLIKKLLNEYLLKISENNINLQSEFARDMMVRDIIDIISPFLKEEENSNIY